MTLKYREKDGLRYVMQQKEASGEKDQFPSHIPSGANSFTELFYNIESTLNTKIHPHVVAAAAAHGAGLLNDHGVDHVAMVIERAGAILGEKAGELSALEIFFLLLAIHFHDVGNLYGREQHEEKIEEVLDMLGERFPLDTVSQGVVMAIAMSHGGYHEGDKDTIAYLNEIDYIEGMKIRSSLLASILRFADEIADDKNRSSQLLSEGDVIPDGNRIFHEYSSSLEPPVIEGDTLRLTYYIPFKYANEKITKNDTQVYLYDEILSRMQKCLCELDYCKRYSQGFIRLSCISVHIAVLSEKRRKSVYKDDFRLKLRGYPSLDSYNPLNSCMGNTIKIENGEALAKHIGGKNE